MLWFGLKDVKTLAWRDVMAIELYANDIFRSTIFVMSLTVAIMAVVAQSHKKLVLRLCLFLVLITAAYSLYVLFAVHRMMRGGHMYSPMTPLFYVTAIITIVIIAFVIFVYGESEQHPLSE